mmetsp:Transcript_126846/g.370881  ORF Transcript_126846/g.370881 Transcript_126846/m.370881 type:complete len:209 (-) Transcript_126846:74-700(-)
MVRRSRSWRIWRRTRRRGRRRRRRGERSWNTDSQGRNAGKRRKAGVTGSEERREVPTGSAEVDRHLLSLSQPRRRRSPHPGGARSDPHLQGCNVMKVLCGSSETHPYLLHLGRHPRRREVHLGDSLNAQRLRDRTRYKEWTKCRAGLTACSCAQARTAGSRCTPTLSLVASAAGNAIGALKLAANPRRSTEGGVSGGNRLPAPPARAH